MEKEILSLLLQDFPESIIFAVICFILLNLKLDWRNILIIAFLQAFTNLVRLLPIAFGMHTVILTFSLVLYIRLVTKLKLSKIFMAVTTCMLVVIVAQMIYLKPMMKLFNLDYQNIALSPFYRAVFTLPSYVALLLIPVAKKAYILKRE